VWRFLTAQAVEQAAPDAGQAAPQSALGGMLPMLVIFFAIMYFLMIRPQQKRERERREMLSSVERGDAVITTGGVCGTVVNLSEDRVILRVDDNVTMEFLRAAIAKVERKNTGK